MHFTQEQQSVPIRGMKRTIICRFRSHIRKILTYLAMEMWEQIQPPFQTCNHSLEPPCGPASATLLRRKPTAVRCGVPEKGSLVELSLVRLVSQTCEVGDSAPLRDQTGHWRIRDMPQKPPVVILKRVPCAISRPATRQYHPAFCHRSSSTARFTRKMSRISSEKL